MWSRTFVLAGLVILTACARPAPELPRDYGSVNAAAALSAAEFSVDDLALTCDDVDAERNRLAVQNRHAEAIIKADRTSNQVAAYFAGLFLLPIVAVDTNEKQVALLDANQRRLDQLLKLHRFKDC